MNPKDFIHPEDAAALQTLQAIPGFPQLVKKLLALGIEQMQYGVNMASSIRLSEKQLPDLYRHLPPICAKLGIAEPEFYLQMDPQPNAWTCGDTRIWITITSGLVDMMNEEELDAVIAHECGHILCRHVLYHTMASWISAGLTSNGLFDKLALPAQLALCYWQRKSELSADRAAAIITSPEVVAHMMARFSGGPQDITSAINIEEWAKQADQYEAIRNDGLWNKTLQMAVTATLSHPFAAVRVREILKWKESGAYAQLANTMNEIESKCCPQCGKPVESDWSYCRHCGYCLM